MNAGMGLAHEELLRALEEYLPVLLGLVKEGEDGLSGY